jgi:hypothetical protein
MTNEQRTERKPQQQPPDGPGSGPKQPAPEEPNEGSPGHHPTDDDVPKEDLESEQSFPASDPPANY